MVEDDSNNESIITAEIPIAEFRKNRQIPTYHLELVKPVFDQYPSKFPLNHLDLPPEELPKTGEEMKALLDKVSNY